MPFTKIANAVANATTYTDKPADPTITYDYRVTAWNASGRLTVERDSRRGAAEGPAGLTAVVQSDADAACRLEGGSQLDQ